MTPLSLWGGDTLIYRSIIVLAAVALPTVAVANWFLRGTVSWPQMALAGATLAAALLCYRLSNLGKRDVAAALLIGAIWFAATIYAFESGYGMHSAVVFMYLPCVLYTALFFGLTSAAAELTLTVAVLVLMYLAEESGRLGGASAFVTHGTNFNFLLGVILTSIGTLIVGVVYHRRVEREAARVVTEAGQRRQAMEQAQAAQNRLETVHAQTEALNSELAQAGKSRELELARATRDLDLVHDVVSKDLAGQLRALREALTAPDEQTEARLRAAVGRMEATIAALESLARDGQSPLQRTPLDLSALARESVRELRDRGALSRVNFDIDEGLRAEGDRKLIAALLRHLIKRAAGACKAELQPLVHVGGGSREGQAVFYVRDNGPGMDAAAQEKLFRPVQPGSAMENTVDIGIVSARRAVERHGGELVLESARGQGTTFFFSLPAG